MGPNGQRSRSARPRSPSRRGRGCGCPWPAPTFRASGRRRRTRRSASASARTVPRRCAYPSAIWPIEVARLRYRRRPAVPDPGWVTGGEPRYHVAHDKAAGEVAVTFGARSSLRPPSGTEMSLDQRFTARCGCRGARLRGADRTGRRRPGAARRGAGGGGRPDTSSRTTSLDAGPRHPGRRAALRAHLDQRRVAKKKKKKKKIRTEPHSGLPGYAQPCVAHAGEFVEVKVSTTQPGFTAEVVRLGLTAGLGRAAGRRRHPPGRRQELVSGSYLIASLGESLCREDEAKTACSSGSSPPCWRDGSA